MAVKFQDYYETLGVNRTTTQDEIRSAFRKLARKYHPDVAKDKKAAEEKFKEINEAYEVLSDPEKRKKYDHLGANWQQGQQFTPPPGWSGGQQWQWRGGQAEPEFQFNGTGFSDFFEALFGTRRGGFGGFGDFTDVTGAGGGMRRQPVAERGRDVEADIMVTLEEALRGSTRSISLQRQTAPGKPAATETYTVKIPPGIREGQRIRLSGRGETGAAGGTAGDLYLRVRFARHPDFRVQGDDLYYDLEVAPWEAVMGAQVEVSTLSGRATLKIPPGTQAGSKMRLPKMGLPRKGGERGDLYAVVKVQVPSESAPEERQLWEQLARVSRWNPRS